MCQRYQQRIALLLVWAALVHVEAWSSPRATRFSSAHYSTRVSTASSARLFLSADNVPEASAKLLYSESELESLRAIVAQADEGDVDMEQAVRQALPSLHPSLVMKLRQARQDENPDIALVSQALTSILNQQLDQAKQTLTDLLNAGEIRKLDALIGKAARENRLDVAFFNVLTANLQDAMAQEAKVESTATTNDPQATSRTQILQHVYTRCQEEVEKTSPPGTALLNKLLRTEQPAIRSNLYKHYLVESSEPQTIITPDGKSVQLKTASKALVSLDDFVSALAQAVEKIRTVQQAGATNRETAAALVESCRSVAKEARIVLGQEYGPDAPQVKQFEDGLQPVFRPMSADSPYIKGV